MKSMHHERAGEEFGGIGFPLFLLVLFVSIVVCGAVAFAQFTHTNPFSLDFFEQAPPEITWKEEPVGIGLDPSTFHVTFTDSGAGLDEVLIRLIHRELAPKDKTTELVRRKLAASDVREEAVAVSIDPKKLNLKEGNVELQLAAFDKTFWSNGIQVSKIIPVNFSKPRLDVVTPEQNGTIGGTQIVFYRVLGKAPTSQGVNIKGTFYQGFPAHVWDPSFKSASDLYLSLFPVPLGFDDAGERMKITARDNIGNSAQALFNYRLRPRRSGTAKVDLSPERAAQITQNLANYAREASLKPTLTKDLGADLKTLLDALKLHDEAMLTELLSRTDGRRWWKGQFSRPLPSHPTASFGDMRTVSISGNQVLQDRLTGARFQTQSRSTVQAANSGRVAFVGQLGLLGETVVIDHGLGLSSVYGHLSTATVSAQDEVTQGQPIGKTGQSGFSPSEEVFFEMRLQGTPIASNEWLDPVWVKDHIDNKVSFVKESL